MDTFIESVYSSRKTKKKKKHKTVSIAHNKNKRIVHDGVVFVF